jgi:hypothetical protein
MAERIMWHGWKVAVDEELCGDVKWSREMWGYERKSGNILRDGWASQLSEAELTGEGCR